VCGTKEYAAPEVNMGGPYMGERADIFSLGVTFFNMIAGKQPFPSSINSNLYKCLISMPDRFWNFHFK
jgi:serine/threonine protein kinase